MEGFRCQTVKWKMEIEFDCESKGRILNDLMSYAIRNNDYDTGTYLNLADYSSLHPLMQFDLSFQTKVARDPKQLIFRDELSVSATENFFANAVVLFEEMIKNNEIGNQLVTLAKTIQFYLYFMSILMLSYFFLYYFFLSDLYLIPILPDRENGATILIVFYFYFKPILRQD